MPSILIIGHPYDYDGHPNHLTFWKLPQLLSTTYGFDVGMAPMSICWRPRWMHGSWSTRSIRRIPIIRLIPSFLPRLWPSCP